MPKIYFHVDVNSAFLSWSALKALQGGSTVDLRTIPAVVGGDEAKRHGVVLAKSTPAKKFGIQTGGSLFAARVKCPGLTVVPPDFDFYVKNSKALVQILNDYTPDVEQYSIDEAFLDMTGTEALLGPPLTRSAAACAGSWASRSTSALHPTACWPRWPPTLKSPTGCIPYINTRSRLRCGRCRWATCSASAPARPSA